MAHSPPTEEKAAADNIFQPSSADAAGTQTISPEIVKELKDFIDLIPTAVVDELVAKHYIIDGNFRTALKYLRSTQFKQLLERVQLIPEVIEILTFLHLTAATRPVAAQIAEPRQNVVEPPVDIMLLDGLPVTNRSAYNKVGTFTNFVVELLDHLPHNDYVRMINEKRGKNAVFAEFYAALRSSQFQPMVDAAMVSTNLRDVIKTLGAHDIDVKSLLPIAFKVISWGPAI